MNSKKLHKRALHQIKLYLYDSAVGRKEHLVQYEPRNVNQTPTLTSLTSVIAQRLKEVYRCHMELFDRFQKIFQLRCSSVDKFWSQLNSWFSYNFPSTIYFHRGNNVKMLFQGIVIPKQRYHLRYEECWLRCISSTIRNVYSSIVYTQTTGNGLNFTYILS